MASTTEKILKVTVTADGTEKPVEWLGLGDKPSLDEIREALLYGDSDNKDLDEYAIEVKVELSIENSVSIFGYDDEYPYEDDEG